MNRPTQAPPVDSSAAAAARERAARSPPPPLLDSTSSETLRRTTALPLDLIARFAVRAPVVTELSVNIGGTLITARVVTGETGPVAGVDLRVPADRVPERLPIAYPNVPSSVLRSDPYIGRALQQCHGRGSEPLTLFFPLPASLQPQLELSARPQAPNGDREPTFKSAALDRPRSAEGASIKRDAGAPPVRERPDTAERMDPSRMAPKPANGEPALMKQHEAYSQAREQLQGAVVRAQVEHANTAPLSIEPAEHSLAAAHPGLNVRDGKQLEVTRIPERLLEQLTRLDGSARELFARPGWQREASFQRAMLLSLFAAGGTLEQAHKEIFQLFGGRMSIDLDQLTKLAVSYGLAEPASQQSLEGKQVDAAQLAREAQEKALLRDKVKTGRTPEEMLLAQQQSAAVTGGKKKLKGTLDRIEGVGAQLEDQSHAEDDEEEAQAQDEEDTAEHDLPIDRSRS